MIVDTNQLLSIFCLSFRLFSDAEFHGGLVTEASTSLNLVSPDDALTGEDQQSKEEKIFINVSETPNVSEVEPVEESTNSDQGWWAETELRACAFESKGQQQIVVEIGQEVDTQHYVEVQNMLSSPAVDNGMVENGVIAEHSYYSFRLEGQKPDGFENVAVKQENADCSESDADAETASASLTEQKCPHCSKCFRKNEQLERHITEDHTGETLYQCESCSQTFVSEDSFSTHTCLPEGSKPYLCDLCGSAFAEQQLLNEHGESHHGHVLVYQCGTCNSLFPSPNKLRLHVAISHKTANKGSEDTFERHSVTELRVCCDDVNESSDKTQLYLCETCGKHFKTAWSLKNHEKMHNGVHTLHHYQCQHCNKKFIHKSQVDQHMLKHTGLKPYTCPKCDKSYSQKGSLTQHMRTHTGEKPFVCQKCGKAFALKSMLHQHLHVHTGEKPHVCQVCGKAFLYKESLSVHLRIHTGEKPYVCNVCNKRYTQSHHLKGHILVHTGEKPFTCSFCEKAYKNRVDLRLHCQRVHQVNITKRSSVAQNTADTKVQ